MNPLRILILGSKGRMGQMIFAAAQQDPEVMVSGLVDQGDNLLDQIDNCDVIIDFSHHSTLESTLQAAQARGKYLVIGTTGHSDAQIEVIRRAAQSIPIVFAPNYSVGVNTLFWLTKKAAEILGPDFDLEVVEMHHRLKKDAPSGTAKRLAEILAEVRALSYNNDTRHGRYGLVGERTHEEIGVHAIRGGDVVGDHTVVFAGIGERVELTHKASSRETFARGSIRAAKWLSNHAPGLYDMQDVLGLK